MKGESNPQTRSKRQVNLSNCYERRFVLLGYPEDLTRGIELSQEACKWPGPVPYDEFLAYCALARRLEARFGDKFKAKDLDASQEMFGRALECLEQMPQSARKTHLADILVGLAVGSWMLYGRTHDDLKKKELLEDASQNMKKLFRLQETGGELDLYTLNNFSSLIGGIYRATGDSEILDQAKQLAILFVSGTGLHDLNRVRRLRTLGRVDRAKGDHITAIKVLEEPMYFCQEYQIRAITLYALR